MSRRQRGKNRKALVLSDPCVSDSELDSLETLSPQKSQELLKVICIINKETQASLSSFSGGSGLGSRSAKFSEQVWPTSNASSHPPWTFHHECPTWKEGLPFYSVSRCIPSSWKNENIAKFNNLRKEDNYYNLNHLHLDPPFTSSFKEYCESSGICL